MRLSSSSDFFEVVRRRRSIRKFLPGEVPEEHLKLILEAARLAPSSKNSQPWHFVIVKDPQRKKELAVACHNQTFIADAGAVIACLSDPSASRKHALDTMIAGEHIVLAATALGYGTCWIGAFDPDEVKRLLRVPEDLNVVALIAVGIPGEEPPPRPRKRLEEIVSSEEYGRPYA